MNGYFDFEQMLDDMTELVCRLDSDFRITYANAAYGQSLGIKSEDLLGRVFLDFIPRSYHRDIRKDLKSLSPENPINRYTHQVVTASGAVRWQQWVDKGIFDEDQVLLGYMSVGRDVTREVHNQKELENQHHMIRGILEDTPTPTFVTDARGVITHWNRSCEGLTGVPRKKALESKGYQELFPIGKEIVLAEVFSSPSDLELKELLNRGKLTRKGDVYCHENWFIVNNHNKYLEISILPLYNRKSEFQGLIQTIHDHTSEKKLEEKLKYEALLAAEAQQKLLPDSLDNDFLKILQIFRPEENVSGDFFDYFWMAKENKLFGYLIDIMGTGLFTAIQSASLRVLMNELAYSPLAVKEKLRKINREMPRYFLEDSFAAALTFELDFNKKEITLSGSGINEAFIQSRGKKSWIFLEGFFLGVMADTTYVEQTFSFDSGDEFFFMTDGLFDVIDKYRFAELGEYRQRWNYLRNRENCKPKRDDQSALCIYIK